MFQWLGSVFKANPAQAQIALDEGSDIGTPTTARTIEEAYKAIESVNRGSNMIIHACSSLDFDIKEPLEGNHKIRAKALKRLLNFSPNPHQSANDFRVNIFTDLVFEGHVYIYHDGAHIYHLPANKMVIKTNTKGFISGYTYNGVVEFSEDQIFSFKDTSVDSIYRGSSRLDSARDSIDVLTSMAGFQQGFFDNGAIFGLVLTTDSTLSTKAKERTITNWLQKYNPRKGGKRPVILDSGLTPHSIAQTSFKDMDFDVSIRTHGEKILTALGVPPILLAGGNNANISPNLRLFYLETVMPIIRSFTSSLERYFNYDIEPITSNVTALQPELKEIAAYHSTLVNAGICTANEAREKLRLPKDTDPESDKLRIPANIAGSAANPSEGGAPKKDPPTNDEPKE